MSKDGKEFDLEERLINFAVRIIQISGKLPNTKIGNHIADQMGRSGTSPAPNYGEAQAAESRRDFIHKMKLCLKELRETKVWLRIIEKAKLLKQTQEVQATLDENDQLIAIFVSSITTARKNKIS